MIPQADTLQMTLLAYHISSLTQGVVTAMGLARRMISLLMGACVSLCLSGAWQPRVSVSCRISLLGG